MALDCKPLFACWSKALIALKAESMDFMTERRTGDILSERLIEFRMLAIYLTSFYVTLCARHGAHAIDSL